MGVFAGNSKKTLLAVDFAPDAVRVLDVAMKRSKPEIRSVASGTLPTGGPETLVERHLEALRLVLQTHRISSRRCVASMPLSLVTTRSVLIDFKKPQSPEEQIRATLQNILSFDARDLMFDYWPVTERTGEQTSYEALVVATQKSVVLKYMEGTRKLGLSCVHMDVAPCALATLIAHLLPKQEAMLGTVALGETMGYFAVVEKQRVVFWRPFELPGGKQNPQAGLDRLGEEISKCVSHMVGSLQMDAMSEILAFGTRAQDQAFSTYLTHRFNVQVKTPSPFDALDAVGGGLPDELRASLATDAGDYAAVLGLALQQSQGGTNG